MACWRASGHNTRSVGCLDSAHEENMHTGLLLSQDREGRLRTALVAAWFSVIILLSLSLSWANAPALLTSCHNTTLEWGLPWLGGELGNGCRGYSDLRLHMGGVGLAIIGAYMCSTSGEMLISDRDQTTTARAPTGAKSMHGPLLH